MKEITIELPKEVIEYLEKSSQKLGKDAKWAIEELVFKGIKEILEDSKK